MELNFKDQLALVCAILLLPALCTSQNLFTRSRATFYGSPDGHGNSGGACGFGEYGRDINDGSVAGVSSLWRNGSGCGVCYQVRCKIPQHCDDFGAYVVVTDYGEGDRTDFIMSPHAYSRLGRNAGSSAELFKYGVVEVEYKRVLCKYDGNGNVLLKVNDSSRNPHYLAILLLYAGGTNDITGLEFWQEDSRQWQPMRRAYGAVFDISNPPRGDIKLRFQLSGSPLPRWVESKKVISSNWEAGTVYDTQVQLD